MKFLLPLLFVTTLGFSQEIADEMTVKTILAGVNACEADIKGSLCMAPPDKQLFRLTEYTTLVDGMLRNLLPLVNQLPFRKRVTVKLEVDEVNKLVRIQGAVIKDPNSTMIQKIMVTRVALDQKITLVRTVTKLLGGSDVI